MRGIHLRETASMMRSPRYRRVLPTADLSQLGLLSFGHKKGRSPEGAARNKQDYSALPRRCAYLVHAPPSGVGFGISF